MIDGDVKCARGAKGFSPQTGLGIWFSANSFLLKLSMECRKATFCKSYRKQSKTWFSQSSLYMAECPAFGPACVQVFRLYTTPNLNGPKYEVCNKSLLRFLQNGTTIRCPSFSPPISIQVLRRTAAYEVRRYESYVVAETPMGSGQACFADLFDAFKTMSVFPDIVFSFL